MQLRPYQEHAVSAVLRDWQTHSDTLIVAATGAGKTVMLLEVTRRVLRPGYRALLIAHRRELVTQPLDRIAGFTSWPFPVGVVMGKWIEPYFPLTVATVQTLASERRRHELVQYGPIDYLITDEAHHMNAVSYLSLRSFLREVNPNLRHLGVTATPFRGDGESLGEVFNHVSATISIADLVRDKWLVYPSWYGIKTDISIAGVRRQEGDFAAGELARRFDTPRAREIIVKAYQKYAPGRSAIAFTSSVPGAYALAEAFCSVGVPAVAVDAKTSDDDRRRVLAEFKAGQYKVLVNMGLFTEGYDAPWVSCILQGRPTSNDSLYVQMIGRGLRPVNGRAFPGEDCVILDFIPQETRNIIMLGDILGLPREAMEHTLAVNRARPEGSAQASFIFDGSTFATDDTPFDVLAEELAYLARQDETHRTEQIQEWARRSVSRAEMARRLGGPKLLRVVEQVLGPLPHRFADPALPDQVRVWDKQGLTRHDMIRLIGGPRDAAAGYITEVLGVEAGGSE